MLATDAERPGEQSLTAIGHPAEERAQALFPQRRVHVRWLELTPASSSSPFDATQTDPFAPPAASRAPSAIQCESFMAD